MKKKIMQNIFLNIIMKILTYIFSFLTIFYITRIFSPELFGRLSFSNSIISYFVMISNLGMPIYAMRLCAQNKNNRKELSKIFNELFSIRIILSAISIILLIISIIIIPKFNQKCDLLLLYGSSIIFQMIGCEWLYKGLEKFKFLTINLFIFKLISFIGIILFVHTKNDYIIYILLSLISSYGFEIIYFIKLHNYVDLSFKININKKHFKPLIVFFLMSCAVSIYTNLDIVILSTFKNDYVTGLYSLVSKIKNILTITGGIFWTSILPSATTLWKEEKYDEFEKLTQKTLTIIFLIQLFTTMTCFILSKQIILIIGGNEYIESTKALKITLFSLIPIGLSNILGGQVLIPTGKEKELLKAEIAGTIFNLIANIIIIPIYSLEGAAATTVISEIIVWIMCTYYINKELNMNFYFAEIKKIYNHIYGKIKKIKIYVENNILNKNNKYYCPCCETKLKKFYDGGFKKSPKKYNYKRYEKIEQNVICPICGSLPRHRIIVSWMNENKEKIKNKKILHFAQEKSIYLWLERNNIEYITADINGEADLLLDIENTKLEDKSIEMIICNHVLEHVNDYKKALKELKRIIKPNGLIIISFPVDTNYKTVYEEKNIKSPLEKVKKFGQNDHLRIFGKDSKKMLEKIGFTVEEINGKNYDEKIKPIIGPADYDYNIIYLLQTK